VRQRRHGHGSGAGERSLARSADMNTSPQFRLAIESDAELLLDFMRDYYAFDGHAYDREKARAALIVLLCDANLGAAWLILDDANPVGYIVLCFGYSLEWLGRDAFVDEFYLREEYRGRGWGKEAMVFLEGAARDRDVRALHLEVMEGNETALHLYQKLGFREHESTFHSKWIARDFSKPQLRSRDAVDSPGQD
jgi:ribosomal protein S18 acetylase RimI-like enzyme